MNIWEQSLCQMNTLEQHLCQIDNLEQSLFQTLVQFFQHEIYQEKKGLDRKFAINDVNVNKLFYQKSNM